MKIAIDVSQIVYGTGVSAYTRRLVESLLMVDRENEYVLFGGALRRRQEILNTFPGAHVFPIPPVAADILWNRLHVLPIEKLIGKVDVFHTSDWSEPPSVFPKVTTVHDLYPLKFPKMIDPKVAEVHKRRLYWVMKEAKRIIAPSISTKNDLIASGFDENIVRVIPEAPNLRKATAEQILEVRKKYQIREDYLISVGITPLKNTKRIIKAFRLGTTGKDLKLILVGRPVGIKIEPERNVRILGYVPQEDLAALLTGSRGLVFASLYEGYGIPILDGFACGVPVITSSVGSMPEVAGDAAVVVDPTSVNSIAEGIERVVRGGKGLVEKGNARVRDFSWEKTAQMTLEVYKEAGK
jgi:glycosyltransferase involved in cell wall biosynthesis